MQLRLGLTLALSVVSLAGCSSLAVNNGSLDYKETATLEPLKYPVLENKRGNRFAMPRPQAAQVMSNAESTETVDTAVSRPQLIIDGNKNPLLKIEGNSATIWQYTLATLRSLNHQIVGQSKNGYEATIKIDQQVYVLRLTAVGSSNNLAVFNADNSFAAPEKATELLTQIYQNWPA